MSNVFGQLGSIAGQLPGFSGGISQRVASR